MKHRRPGHYRLKAARGAYSDRHVPRPGHPPAAATAEPWRQDWPAFGLPAVTILADGTVLRRR